VKLDVVSRPCFRGPILVGTGGRHDFFTDRRRHLAAQRFTGPSQGVVAVAKFVVHLGQVREVERIRIVDLRGLFEPGQRFGDLSQGVMGTASTSMAPGITGVPGKWP
jgi:hypothetical protein